MHSIVTTEGFVIDSRSYGEAGKLLYIFTRDFGLIVATAQGIRLEKSKLRYFIQDYSFGVYSFVKGKEYWRLTNAQQLKVESEKFKVENKNISENVKLESAHMVELVAKVALLLKKMLHGEEANPELFGVLSELNKIQVPNPNLIPVLESLIVLRIFHKLGYIGDIKELNPLLTTNEITPEILSIVDANRIFINTQINKAIRESHL